MHSGQIRDCLFIYHKEIETCHSNLTALKSSNPDIRIHGLFGGPGSDYQLANARMTGLLASNTLFPTAYSSRWKWKNTDLMVRYWYQRVGSSAEYFDILTVIQWDVLILDNLSICLPFHSQEEVLLGGITKLSDLPNGWAWTHVGKKKEEWVCFKEYARLVHDYSKEFTFCQGPLYSLPRRFLESYTTAAVTELCHDEIRLPFYATLWGFQLKDTGLCSRWRDKETQRLFNASGKPIEASTIENELLKSDGRRIFHPVREKLRLGRRSPYRLADTSRPDAFQDDLSQDAQTNRIKDIITRAQIDGAEQINRRHHNHSNHENFHTILTLERLDYKKTAWEDFVMNYIRDERMPAHLRNYMLKLLEKSTNVDQEDKGGIGNVESRLELLQKLIICRARMDPLKFQLIRFFCEGLEALSPLAFSRGFQWSSQYSKLVMHVSCQKRLSSALQARNSLGQDMPGVGSLILIGDPLLPRLHYRFDEANQILYVSNGDRYEDLTEKVFLAYLFLYCLSPRLPILKIDDDVCCENPSELVNTIFPLIQAGHYVGKVWDPWITGYSRHWHLGRYEDEESSYRPYSGFADTSFAEGCAYGISAESLTILAISFILYPDQVLFAKSYEDLTVGYCMCRTGVNPVRYRLIRDGLLAFQ